MKHKKFLSAVMAIAMIGSMQTMTAFAEELEDNDTEIVDMTEAPVTTIEEVKAPVLTETTTALLDDDYQADITTAPVEGTTTVLSEATTIVITELTSTTAVTGVATTEMTSSDVISADLITPKVGEFKKNNPEDSNTEIAVISWDAVEGADGYQIYRTVIKESEKDTPVAYSFDVKGVSYQTSDSGAYKEIIKIRAFKLVNDERVYSAWSDERIVYMNGMQQDTVATSTSTTTSLTNSTSSTTTSKTTTVTTKSTTATSNDKKEEVEASPKTGDNIIKIALIGLVAAALIAVAIITAKKKKD